MRNDDLTDEHTYLRARGAGRSRREMLKLIGSAAPALVAGALVPASALAAPARRNRLLAIPQAGGSPILKPLPPERFIDYGSNAEMRWDTVDFGYLTPVERFFVRDHTATPLIDAHTWQLQLFRHGAARCADRGPAAHADLPATAPLSTPHDHHRDRVRRQRP